MAETVFAVSLCFVIFVIGHSECYLSTERIIERLEALEDKTSNVENSKTNLCDHKRTNPNCQ